MSKLEQKELLAAFEQMRKAFGEPQRRAAAEAERRARLSPEQRAAEDRAVARARLVPIMSAIKKRESWTLEAFSWLLVAQSPDQPLRLLNALADPITSAQRHYRAVLASAVPMRLKPVNPGATEGDQRFTAHALMQLANEKALGCIAVLIELAGDGSADATASNAGSVSTSAMTTPQRVASKPMRRQTQLTEFALELARAGEGSVSESEITLGIQGVILNRRFRQLFPEWRRTTDKTFERDRAQCQPRISVATGRPPFRQS